ncbi:AarF/ABC1/UbiB kinase family protein [Qipengyuania sp. 6B39]|uniref:ABC1 kinase family protein n=1 Tax=Qipengyuania proteolytica TaxID=2867239 RepID=UPI001C89DC92|nr:AarF/ABC1/UbiB kinase family protein [Qipengyuania proteolytica]MBX7495898.1 AarF/ABC1/UbiB kinase family protein [Qipengyuania proteolytica]
MTDDIDGKRERHRSVPSTRAGRLAGFTRLAGGVAGGMVSEGARRLVAGERPSIDQLILTPGNAKRLADRLAHLRGAAMKLGQMISMDAGDFLPPELADILARLRDRANFMPPRQLDKVLTAEWGKDWRRQFRRFEPRPIAAASIGQVHRALTSDGRLVAIKVQYPGIAQSIDSDVDNVASLLKVAGLLPKELEIAPLLSAAKQQLHEEADYQREGAMMQGYAELLAGDERFVVPTLDTELTRERVLAMSYEEGRPIESLAEEPQEVRDRVFTHLIELVARELFDFGTMQTDPNFANYRYRAADERIVLLDFGAARPVSPEIAQSYRRLLQAGLDEDRQRVTEEAVAAGFLNAKAVARHPERVARVIDIIVSEMASEDRFDFGDRAFVPEIRDTVAPLIDDRESWHLPPAETLFVQRKVSGTALLGARLKARVDVRRIVSDTLARTE